MSEEIKIPPIVSVVGKSNSGKTTLVEKLLPALKNLNLKIGTIKHDVHGFEIDVPGKDSWRHRQAGADRTIISSSQKLALIRDTDHDMTLDELAHYFIGMDMILTEGYKRESKPKIEIFRSTVHEEPLCQNDPNLIALVSDKTLDMGVPCFGLDDSTEIAAFIKDFIS